MSDQLADGRRFRVLTAIDDNVSPRSVCLEVVHNFRAKKLHVTRTRGQAMALYGQPKVIISDNGTQFTGNVFDQRAHEQ